MKIATFNCNSVRARMPIITYWLEKEKPDILALQEIKVRTELFPREPFEQLGYQCMVNGKKGHAGVATLAKLEPDDLRPGFGDGDESEFSRLMTCRWGKLHVINTYVPQGREVGTEWFEYKLEWFKRFRRMLEEHHTARQRVIWLGDFNVAPEPIDVHDSKRIMGHVDHCPEVFEALQDVREWGFTDLFRKFHQGEEGQYTYYDYRVIGAVESNTGWRVDHIYVTNPLVKKAKSCWIDLKPRGMEKPSDHTVLAAEFDL